MFHVHQRSKSAVLEVLYPDPGEVRARTVISRSNSGRPVKTPSWKMGRMIHCESHNERNAVRLLDVCSSVTEISEQPVIVRYVLEGEEHLHYPDLRVRHSGKKELWEVKTLHDAMRPEVQARTRLLTQGLPEYGYNYRVAIAEELAQQPRLDNAKQLLRYGWNPVTDGQREYVRQLLAQVGVTTWTAAAAATDLGSRARSVLSRLALEGVLRFDISQPLTGSTPFSLCVEGTVSDLLINYAHEPARK